MDQDAINEPIITASIHSKLHPKNLFSYFSSISTYVPIIHNNSLPFSCNISTNDNMEVLQLLIHIV